MTEQPQHDPYVSDAVTREQDLLNQAMQRAQAEYLFDRVVALSAENARLAEAAVPDASEQGPLA